MNRGERSPADGPFAIYGILLFLVQASLLSPVKVAGSMFNVSGPIF